MALAIRGYFNESTVRFRVHSDSWLLQIPTNITEPPLLPIKRGNWRSAHVTGKLVIKASLLDFIYIKLFIIISIKLYCLTLGIYIRTMGIRQSYLSGRVDFRVLRNNLFFGYKYQGQSYYLVTARWLHVSPNWLGQPVRGKRSRNWTVWRSLHVKTVRALCCQLRSFSTMKLPIGSSLHASCPSILQLCAWQCTLCEDSNQFHRSAAVPNL